MKELKDKTETTFYLDLDYVTYCYPYKVSKVTRNLGVLNKYIGKEYTEKEINKIVAEFMVKKPYVNNSMDLNINVMYRKDSTIGYYHTLSFRNLDFDTQIRTNDEIKFLYPSEL